MTRPEGLLCRCRPDSEVLDLVDQFWIDIPSSTNEQNEQTNEQTNKRMNRMNQRTIHLMNEQNEPTKRRTKGDAWIRSEFASFPSVPRF